MDTDLDNWISDQETRNWKKQFEENGFLIVENLLTLEEVELYRSIYDKLLKNEIDASKHRHDLGSHVAPKVKGKENICQIMWPSDYVDGLVNGALHQRARKIAQIIFGDDMAFDFDMLIAKSPHTDTVTPMHQDEGYWLDMPDKRAVSVWVALDDATEQNGCMQFVAGSHKRELRQHRPAKEGHHVLCCDGDLSELISAPIKRGSCTLHHGRTIHYTGGNTTNTSRRAYIVNFRAPEMIDFERNNNYDHGRNRGTEDLK